jgi:hypothetical protein
MRTDLPRRQTAICSTSKVARSESKECQHPDDDSKKIAANISSGKDCQGQDAWYPEDGEDGNDEQDPPRDNRRAQKVEVYPGDL